MPTAPAVGQRFPFFGFVDDFAVDVSGDIACCYGRTAFFGLEGIHLFVQGANIAAFFVVECGPVNGAGQMVFRIFTLAAGVDQGVKFMEAMNEFCSG